MKTLLRTYLLLILLLTGLSDASERIVIGGLTGLDPSGACEPPKLKLALSGGGARGLASVGLLRALEEQGIQVTAIAGTSIGGIVGGLYACGYSSRELADIVHEIDFGSLLKNEPPRTSMFLTRRQGREHHLFSVRFEGLRPHIPKGLTTGQEVTALLISLTNRANYLAGGDFTRFPIPFKTVCTDIITGERVILDRGSLASAMRATIAYPLAFTGVERESRLLMDGGMVVPVPVDIVRDMGDPSQLVVAVNTTSYLLAKEQLVTPVDIASQVTSIMTADKLADQLGRADFVFEPCPPGISATDFKHRDSIMELGYRRGLEAAEQLRAILHKGLDTSRNHIGEVRVITDDRTLADQITADLLGFSFTRDRLLTELKQMVTKFGLFELIVDIQPSSVLFADTGDPRLPLSLTLESRRAWRLDESDFVFDGNKVFDDLRLRGLFPATGTLLTVQTMQEGLERITTLYRENGYDLAGVREVEINAVNRRIRVSIDEAVVQRIDVVNSKRTKDWLIRSHFPIKRGEPFSTDEASKGVANIYATDLFERVTLDLEPSNSGAIVKIGVTEKKYSQLRLGWHWHEEYESEQFLEFLDDNVFGIGMENLIHAQYGNDRWKYYTQMRIHRLFFTYLTAQARAFYDRRDRMIFDGEAESEAARKEERIGVLVRLGQQISRFGTVTGGLTFEEVKLTDKETGRSEKFGLRTLHLQSLVETFNRMPFPETGNKHLFEIDFVGKALGGDVEFTKLYSSLEAYWPLTTRINYHPKISVGISRTGLPASERFYIGGSRTFPGFRRDQLSGDKVLLFNQEVRLRLPFHLYLFTRYAAGEVYSGSEEIKLRNLRHGYGFSLALETPVGPFEFGYGVADSDTDRFYFNAGFQF